MITKEQEAICALTGKLARAKEECVVGVCGSIRTKLIEASRGEPETFGFVSMFMAMIDDVEKEYLARIEV